MVDSVLRSVTQRMEKGKMPSPRDCGRVGPTVDRMTSVDFCARIKIITCQYMIFSLIAVPLTLK